MRKQCRQCRSTTNVEAPYCDACGCEFSSHPPIILYDTSWRGRFIAIVAGLAVAVIMRYFTS